MAEEALSDSCEEPDADFFDTFFDDGVVETIGKVLGSQKPDDDSSCEPLDITPGNSTARKDELRTSTSLKSHLLETSNKCALSKDKVIVLKPAQIKDQDSSVKGKKLECTTVLETLSTQITIDVRNPEASSRRQIICNDSAKCTTNSDDPSYDDKCASGKNLGLNELLSKVQKFLIDTPAKNENVVKDIDADVPVSDKSSKCSQNEEKTELRLKVQNILADAPLLKSGAKERSSSNSKSDVKKLLQGGNETEQAVSPEKTVLFKKLPISNLSETIEDNASCRVKGSELTNQTETLGFSHASDSEVKRTSEDVESDTLLRTPQAQDDTEKENDLTLEETCPKQKNQQTSPGKKINLNLKTQILASTTILNSGLQKKSNQCSSDMADKKKKDSVSSHATFNLKDLSPISDEDTQETKRRKKKKQERSATRGSISPDREKSKHSSRERKLKKKKRRDDSPKLSRRDRDIKKSRLKRKRSRSRSPSPQYHDSRNKSWKQSERVRSPNTLRRKRRRSFSRSPSLSSRRFVRRSRSPFRYRSRSRSYSPDQRFHQSPSPTTRRRRSSRSKSRSPFINEICRLKKQWEKEDEEKRSSSQYLQTHPEVGPTHLPSIQPWANERERSSSRIISNMVSVQVHSASFTFGKTVETAPQRYEHLIQPYAPSNFIAPLIPPNYSPYATNPAVPSSSPLLPGLQGSKAPLPYSSDNVLDIDPPIVPAQLALPAPSPAPVLKDVDKQQTSLLRKQLDILKSTVVSLPEPRSSGKCGTKNVRTCNPPSTQSCPESKNVHNTSSPQQNYKKRDPQTKNQSPVSNICNPKNSIASSIEDDVGSGPLNAKASTPPCAFQESSADNVSLSIGPDPENSKHCINSPSLKPSESPSRTSMNLQNSSALKDNSCTQTILEIEVNDNPKKSETGESDSSLQPPAGSVVTANQTEAISETWPNLQGEQNNIVNVDTEEYDSDIIVEEVPPKPPVELICLSEEDINIEDDIEISVQDDLNHEFDLINMGLDTTCEPRQPINDNGLPKTAPTPGSSDHSQRISEPNLTKKKKRSRRRRRREGSHTRMNHDLNDAYTSRKTSEQEQPSENAGESLEESRDSVLKECREMIDSLRIGRFVVVDEDPSADEPVACIEERKSTSIICRSSKVEFSFSQRPIGEEVPKTKDVSTNTPIQLCIDVCTGTEHDVMLKHCMTQTDLTGSCRQCFEKETLVKEMNDQLLSLRKERDELNAIICSLKKKPAIPGLDFSSRDMKTTSQQINEEIMSTSHQMFQTSKPVSNKVAKVCNDVQRASKSVSRTDPKSLIANEALTRNIRKSFQSDETKFINSSTLSTLREPVLSYDYNHSLPN